MDSIPFDMPANIPFVVMEAYSAASPLTVLLDTGAAAPFDVIISPRAAEATGAASKTTGHHVAQGVSGAKAAVTPVTLPSFRLGPVMLTNASAAIHPGLEQVSAKVGRPIDALVGANFLRGRVVSINYDTRQVDFQATPAASVPELATFAQKRPLLLVKVKVNGEGPFVLALDTGASHSLLSASAAERLALKPTGTLPVTGAGGVLETQMAQATIRFGAAEQKVTVLVSGAVDQIAAAAGSPLDGVLGADIFGRGTLTIDYAKGRVWSEPSKPKS